MKRALYFMLALLSLFSLAVMFTSCGNEAKLDYKLSDNGRYYRKCESICGSFCFAKLVNNKLKEE